MKIGALILCRYNSSRLPGKILKPIKGKPILENIHRRLQSVDCLDEIVVCTSDQESDDPIVQFCEELQFKYFRGSLEDVSHRFLSTALKHDFDYGVRINGDNIFVDTDLLSEMCAAARSSHYDFISNLPGRTFPYGMSIEIVRTKYYQEVYTKFEKSEHLEHVTKYLYDNESEIPSFKYFTNIDFPFLKQKQLAVDTSEDYHNAITITDELPQFPEAYSLADIDRVISNLNLNLKK